MTKKLSMIKILFTVFACIFFISCAAAQEWTKIDEDWDDNNHRNRNRKYCEVREITLQDNRDVISVDGLANGGIRIKGWRRDEIRIRANICAWDRDRNDAKELVSAIDILTNGKTIHAEGPSRRRRKGWSVSYRLMVPKKSDLSLETTNGGITIGNVYGEIDFDATNGGIKLSKLGGNVNGSTTNGGIEVNLDGKKWRGEGLDVKTTNGGVKLDIPEDYSANLETGTVNGNIHIDFPIMVQGDLSRVLHTKIGNGGPRIRVVTTNGSVRIRQY